MAQSGFWRKILISLGLLLLASLCLVLNRPRNISVDEISLDTSAARIKGKRGFSCLAQGHGGSKLQYAAKTADKAGGYYCVECEDAKVTAIYISYDKPISREMSLKTVGRLVGDARPVEIDSNEVKNHTQNPDHIFLEAAVKEDEMPRCEYLYFRNGNYAELQYSQQSQDKVSRIISYRGS